MSEFSYPFNVTDLLFSVFYLFSSFIFSHPLYLSYFIFFSPYFLKLFYFLSPLFITTSLFFLLILFTISPDFPKSEPHVDVGLILSVLDKLQSADVVDNEEGASSFFEDLEVYKLVFETFIPENKVTPVPGDLVENSVVEFENPTENLNQNPESEEEETCKNQETEAEVNSLCFGSNEGEEEEARIGTRCNAASIIVSDDLSINGDLVDNGPVKKENEWRRTLAYKLYEERNNNNTNNGGEGMDMLWETYERIDDSTTELQTKENNNGLSKIKECYSPNHDGDDDDDEVCCLQALRFSTGKMNLGMGKSKFVKMSKAAIKGFGWLNHVNKIHKKKSRH